MTADNQLTTFNALQRRLQADYDKLHTWQAVGRKHGISGAMAWRIVKQDYTPKSAKIRAKLGLPHIIEVEVMRDEKGRFVER